MAEDKAKDMSLVDEEVDTRDIPLLPPQQQRFVQLYLTGQYSLNKLAELLGVHVNTLYKWLRKDDVKQAIQEYQDATHEIVASEMKSMTLQAVKRMRELMNSPIDGVALQAVKDVLDRTGHKPKQQIEKNVTVKTFEEKLSDLIDDVIEGEFEEVD